MLEIHDFSVAFSMYGNGREKKWAEVISAMDIPVCRGEVVAIIGSGWAGKSILAHAVLGILPPNARMVGTITIAGEVLTEARKRALRGETIALVPQSVGDLDPLVRVKGQAARLSGMTRPASHGRQAEVFARYGLDAGVTLETVGRPGALLHPYKRGPWHALPQNGFHPFRGLRLPSRRGAGYPYVRACPRATAPCVTSLPPLTKSGNGDVRCHHA